MCYVCVEKKSPIHLGSSGKTHVYWGLDLAKGGTPCLFRAHATERHCLAPDALSSWKGVGRVGHIHLLMPVKFPIKRLSGSSSKTGKH